MNRITLHVLVKLCGIGLMTFLFNLSTTVANPSSEEPVATGINLDCPADIVLSAASGQNGANVSWNEPVASTGCTINVPGNCSPQKIVHWGFANCSVNNGQTNYSEFTPSYPNTGGLQDVDASVVFRESGEHSCAPGSGGGTAMCVGTRSSCSFIDDDEYALRFNVTLTPDQLGRLTRFDFFEKAPTHYQWTTGGSGSNNYPRKYGIRILKDGHEVFKRTDVSTSRDWDQEIYDFSNNPDFEITGRTTFSFELRAYCRVGNGASRSIWDIDNFSIYGCGTTTSTIPGTVSLNQISGLANGAFFPIGTTQVKYEATDNCGNSETCEFNVTVNTLTPPPCNISITAGLGTITVNGLDGVNNTVQIFNATWREVAGCNSNCGPSATFDNLSTGRYFVSAKTYDATWKLVCVEEIYIDVVGSSCTDNDQDGVCEADDCNDNDPNLPLPAGTPCDDGNASTTNDVIQADGCSCLGVPVGSGPDCDTDISITTGNGTIIVSGLDGAPVSSLQIFSSDWTRQLKNCFADCSATETVSVPTGTYLVYAKYYTAGYQLICERDERVTVTGGDPCSGQGGDSDGDGVCDNQDNCVDVPNPGQEDADGDGIGDACDTVDPCAGQGGDSDGDGICDNQDCAPNNAFLPTTPGTACNDGNPNTVNDLIQADGCSCVGTPVGGPDCDTDISITTGNGTIIVSGLDGAPVSSLQIFSSDWTRQLKNCFADCSATETVSVPAGTYLVYAKYYTAGYQLICERHERVTVTGGDPCLGQGGDSDGDGVCDNQDNCVDIPNPGQEDADGDGIGDACDTVDPCAGQGGDSDGDGVCDNQDCAPNDASLPTTPGTACNDGNPNTTDDVIQADGCSCAGTPVGGGACDDNLAYWSLDACSPGSSYSEFTAVTSSPNGLSVNASIFSNPQDHSCTPGVSGVGVCSDSQNSCTYQANGDDAYEFSVTLNPASGFTASLSKLEFYEQAPDRYVWTNGGSGDNDPPSKYGVRVLKDGHEIFRRINIATTGAWSLERFDFSNDPEFTVSDRTTFSFELLGYCRQGSSGQNVWDIDEVKILGCSDPQSPCAGQGGDSDGDGICDNQDCAPNNASLPTTPGTACNDGNPNTTNDVIQSDGCSCAGTPVGGGTCDDNLAYWSLDACIPGSSYNEFTATTNSPGGVAVSASIFKHNDDDHSCTPGISGEAVCSDTRDNCTYSTSDDNTFEFSVTLRPESGATASLSKLEFYERAPDRNNFSNGNSSDNDPPSKYGIRVLKDGHEIYRRTNLGTTNDWTLESFDFANEAEFTVSSKAKFTFELLGYCRQGSGGLSVWDIDEVKVFGCAEPQDPCAGQGGDSDGDGVCDNQDCAPNNASLPTTPGTACNDGNPNTVNDLIQADGCSCVGTPVGGPDCDADISITTGNGTIIVSGLDGAPVSSLQIFSSDWTRQFANCFADCSATETINVPSGTYLVYVKYYTASYQLICERHERVTVTGGADPCIGQGGDSDGDGVCDNQDCAPNNAFLPATPGTSCDDGNPNTVNDVIQSDGCSCLGAPPVNCNIDINLSTDQSKVIVTGLSNAAGDISTIHVFDAQWQEVFACSDCGDARTIDGLASGVYHVIARIYNSNWQKDCEKQVTVTIVGGPTICADRDVSNTNRCGSGADYGGYLLIDGESSRYSVSNGKFVEFTDGTGRFTALWTNNGDDRIRFEVDILFSGRTANAPSGSPKHHECRHPNTSDFYYYTNTTGQLTGQGKVAGAIIDVTRRGEAFQLGKGANVTHDGLGFGASGWLQLSLVQQPSGSYSIHLNGGNNDGKGDINIQLSGDHLACINGSSRAAARLVFDAYQSGRQIELKWATNTGYKNDYFIIQRSSDKLNYNNLKEVSSLYEDEEMHVYNNTDEGPMMGMNYYRLVKIHLDGSEEVIDAKAIQFGMDLNAFAAFPNPAETEVQVNLRKFAGKSGMVQIFDQLGHKLAEQQFDQIPDRLIRFDVRQYKEGMYNIMVKVDGFRLMTERIVVIRTE